jgi:unsaturated chondroitin disaccharide hydrolase
MEEKIPYIAENGVYLKDMKKDNLSWWTNGFWAGMLWQMYHASGMEAYRTSAEKVETALDFALENFEGLHHDVGFMWLHTAVANYRLTGNTRSRNRGMHAATILAGRFNPAGNFLRAWNHDKTGWMIIDSMMNIHLLYWAARETGDPRFSYIANQHANTALRIMLREDGSCNHIAVLNPENGELLELPGGQGYSSGSSWSRGQAWALYGFAQTYFHTRDLKYLEAAKKIAHYFIANISMTGYVSLVDFRAPKEPIKWDSTASACAACGLLLLADESPEYEKELYYCNAVKILRALEEKYCNWKIEEDGILQYGTAAYHRDEDTHVPIIYGDYFFIEGILRLKSKSFNIW